MRRPRSRPRVAASGDAGGSSSCSNGEKTGRSTVRPRCLDAGWRRAGVRVARCGSRPHSRLPHACDAVPRRAAGTYLSSSPPGTSVHTSSKYLILLPQSRLLFISSLKTLPFRRTKKNRKSRSSRPTNPPPWLPPQTSRCRTSTAPGSWYVPAGECTRGDGALLLELLFPFCLC